METSAAGIRDLSCLRVGYAPPRGKQQTNQATKGERKGRLCYSTRSRQMLMRNIQKDLSHTHANCLQGTTILLEDEPLAVVPAPFIRDWRIWLQRSDASRPEVMDNSEFFCGHGLLLFDPNIPEDMDPDVVVVVKRSDWAVLETLCVSLWRPRL